MWWLVAAAVVVLIAVLVWAGLRRGTPSAVSSPTVSAVVTPTPSPGGSPARSVSPTPGAHQSSAKSPEAHGSASKPSSSSSASSGTLPELTPVGLDSKSDRPDGSVVVLERIESVAGTAHLPGEVAGPALRLTFKITNNGKGELSLASVIVNGYSGSQRVPLQSLTQPGGKPFSGSLSPGHSATGVYLFQVGTSKRADVTFTVDVTPGTPASVFQGDAR